MLDLGPLPKMLLEIAVLAAVLYVVLRFLRDTRGSGVVRGLAVVLVVGVIGVAILVKGLRLDRLEVLLNWLTQSVVVTLVIVFHPEIRRAIVHLGDSPIFGRFFPQESKIVQRVLRAVARMSKDRMGALIAVERDASLQSLAETGITIDAELNSFLIESIFYPKSALHDGAIVVRDDRIVAASCLLPLSQNPDVDKRLGTRHRAALGLSEETDALAIVVSEETGKVSAALGGKLSFDLTLEQLERLMEESLGSREASTQAERRRRTPWSALTRDPIRKLIALSLGIAIYFFLDTQITSDWSETLRLRATSPGESAQSTFVHGNQLLIDLPLDRLELRGFADGNTGNPVDTVRLSIRGPRYVIDNLRRDQRIELPVKLPTVDWEKVTSVEFTAADIQRPSQLVQPDVHLTMEPERLRVNAVPASKQDVPLTSELVELQLGGDERLRSRVRAESAQFSRPIARLVGPATALEAFTKHTERPFRMKPGPKDNERQISGTVELQPRFAELGLVIAEPVQMTLQLLPVMQEFAFDLPVRVDDLSLATDLRGRYRPDAAVKRARIRVGGQLLSTLIGEGERAAAWASDNLRLSVWIRPRDEGTPYPGEFAQQAALEVLGPVRDAISSQDYGLVETVSVTLRRNGP